jgi:hypothetical protein
LVRVDVRALADAAILASAQKTAGNDEENKRSVVPPEDFGVVVSGVRDGADEAGGEGMAFAASSLDGPVLEIYLRE